MRAKTALGWAVQMFRVAEPVSVLRPRPVGIHRTKTWFAALRWCTG